VKNHIKIPARVLKRRPGGKMAYRLQVMRRWRCTSQAAKPTGFAAQSQRVHEFCLAASPWYSGEK